MIEHTVASFGFCIFATIVIWFIVIVFFTMTLGEVIRDRFGDKVAKRVLLCLSIPWTIFIIVEITKAIIKL